MEWITIEPLYHEACPNCKGPIKASRLINKIPCEKCLPKVPELPRDYYRAVNHIGELLRKKKKLYGYTYLYSSVKELIKFNKFFKKITNSTLWSAQRTWARRLLVGESLAIVAPTGVGKSTLLMIYGVYRSLDGARVYFILPTENLVLQVTKKLNEVKEKVGKNVRIVSYYSSLRPHEKLEVLERIRNGDFDILVTTTNFLSRKWELINQYKFDIVIIDDVDAFLKNSKNIDRVLVLLGFKEDTIQEAYNLVKNRIQALIAKITGRRKLYEELLYEIKLREKKISQEISRALPGQLVIASATGRSYGLKPKILRELLGLDIGRVHDYTRSISNFYVLSSKPVETTVEIIKRLGPGGLVFVSKRYGKSVARDIVEALKSKGIRATLALSGYKVLDKFAEGKYDVLVGMSSYYGVIVRGIDLPQKVLYTVFVGVPSIKLGIEKALTSPHRIARLALELGLDEAKTIAQYISKLGPGALSAIRIALAQNTLLEGRLGEILQQLKSTRKKIIAKIREELKKKENITIGGILFTKNKENNSIEALLIDPATYVQASGRASRMYGSHMTHGISIVIEELKPLVTLLSHRLKRFLENPSFMELNWSIIKRELVKVHKSRRSATEGKQVRIETCLVIVESPTKARTIASFFGRPLRRKIGPLLAYETTFYNKISDTIHIATIVASIGHIYDLSIDNEGLYGVASNGEEIIPVYKPIKTCLNCGYQFPSSESICPRCKSANTISKQDTIEALRQLASEVEVVYIATDPDIEGEKIAYDISNILHPYTKKIKRIELHEITYGEFLRALANSRDLNTLLSTAQIIRRIEDRWIGFGLSRHLWEKFDKQWLGAGRVQTPVLGWIIERYNEWHKSRSYALRITLGKEYPIIRIYTKTRDEGIQLKEIIEKGLIVYNIETTIEEHNPPPPHTTDTLLQDASRTLRYTAPKTMRIAQELFEAGLITYHRTDSTHVSGQGIKIAKEYLEKKNLLDHFEPRSWGGKGHHECIRPTKPIDADTLRKLIAVGEIRPSKTLRETHFRLYDLIFRRFIGSQMKQSTLTKAIISFKPTTEAIPLDSIKIEAYIGSSNSGYIIIYNYPRTYERLVDLKPGTILIPVDINLFRTSKVQLYSHGDIVALMKKRKIGRPSTYARTIEVLLRHNYIIESRYRRKLVPTKLGIDVYNYLVSSFLQLVSEERTRELQEKIERIARGEVNPIQVVADLYRELEYLLGGRYISVSQLLGIEVTKASPNTQN